LDVCKDVLLYRRSSDDDDEDKGQDRQKGGETGDHACVTAVDSTGASANPLSNSGGVSGHNSDEPLADKEGRMEDDLVDYESDPFESPCTTKQLPLILFPVYSVTVKTPTLQRTRYASCASPYIMFGFFFFSGFFFLEARILVLIFLFP
jgi:hypothetical protein